MYAVATICGESAISIHEEGVNFLGFTHRLVDYFVHIAHEAIVPTCWTFVHPTNWVVLKRTSFEAFDKAKNSLGETIGLVSVGAVSTVGDFMACGAGHGRFNRPELLQRAVFVVHALHQ